ncbi:hydrogenase maturation protease [Thermodesulfobacterium sp. TA1]|uniref:hydrogenase maturation protease n=1 Tax=Thermodesulfobacterium sp. TA1 TaxID=2234087 RepID=UPI001232A47F|nr:hydrogenase maturation protease [Thermodesulfobacterium sp. TA1]QER42471.1 hydrogenase maturation protease [Thermodesulfobacterium sp. TA1]
MQKKAIVIGIGNPNFRDDGVGYKIVEQLEGLVDTVCLLNTDLKVIDVMLGYDLAVIVDGVKIGVEPGTIVELDPLKTFEKVYASGTHSLTVFEVIRIGYQVFPEEMPKEIKIIGVEVEDIDTLDRDCSLKVKAAIPKVVQLIKEYLKLT